MVETQPLTMARHGKEISCVSAEQRWRTPPSLRRAHAVRGFEHCFADRLPPPRRVGGEDGGGAEGGGGAGSGTATKRAASKAGRDDLWARAVAARDPRFKRTTQRRVLTQLHELLITYASS